MTPERLAQIENHFRHPASASCNIAWALEMVAEIRALRGPSFAVTPDVIFLPPVVIDTPAKLAHVLETGRLPVFEPSAEFDAMPTPPEAPKPKKKGK